MPPNQQCQSTEGGEIKLCKIASRIVSSYCRRVSRASCSCYHIAADSVRRSVARSSLQRGRRRRRSVGRSFRESNPRSNRELARSLGRPALSKSLSLSLTLDLRQSVSRTVLTPAFGEICRRVSRRGATTTSTCPDCGRTAPCRRDM